MWGSVFGCPLFSSTLTRTPKRIQEVDPHVDLRCAKNDPGVGYRALYGGSTLWGSSAKVLGPRSLEIGVRYGSFLAHTRTSQAHSVPCPSKERKLGPHEHRV